MKLGSSEPFWLVKNGILNSYPSLRQDIETEILIVGGGITGSLIAHRCIADGYHTTLIDRREIGHGSTSATTSMLQYELDIPLHKLIEIIGEKGAVETYLACSAAIDTLSNLVRDIKSDSGFRKKESLHFTARRQDLSSLKTEFETRQQHGLLVTWLERKDIERRYHLHKSYGGILSEQAASVDAFHLTHDILEFNHKNGLAVYDKTNLQSVDYRSNGVTGYTEYGNTIKAKHLIYCTGYESTEIITDNFVRLLSTYAIIGERFEDDQSFLSNTLFWNTADPYMYLRTTDDNRLLIGGEDEDFVNARRRDRLLSKKSERLTKYLKSILPDYDFRADFIWAGTFGETKDALPYIGKHPDFLSTYFVLGFGGNGITFSVLGMEIISAMLQNKTHPLAQYFKFRR